MWNEVGGKIAKNESAVEGIIRETFEETGITLQEVIYAGDLTWQSNRGDAGMYVFISELPKYVVFKILNNTYEGILDWKSIDWILDRNNKGIVDNIRFYLPKILEGDYGLHRFVYKDGIMLVYNTLNI